MDLIAGVVGRKWKKLRDVAVNRSHRREMVSWKRERLQMQEEMASKGYRAERENAAANELGNAAANWRLEPPVAPRQRGGGDPKGPTQGSHNRFNQSEKFLNQLDQMIISTA